jgi:hypothetical protein
MKIRGTSPNAVQVLPPRDGNGRVILRPHDRGTSAYKVFALGLDEDVYRELSTRESARPEPQGEHAGPPANGLPSDWRDGIALSNESPSKAPSRGAHP